MAETISKTIVCPKCREQSPTVIMISGNTAEDTGLRKMLFDETMFRWKCKKCGYSSKYLHPFLYNDIARKFMVYYIPRVERPKVVDSKLEQEFSSLGDIRKRIVPEINGVKEKILIFENHLNDMAMELTKLAVSEVVAKETAHNVYEGYFTDLDREKSTISFQFFVGSEKRSYIQSTRLEVYRRSLDIIRRYFPQENKQKGFLNIGREWAGQTLEKYKGLDKK